MLTELFQWAFGAVLLLIGLWVGFQLGITKVQRQDQMVLADAHALADLVSQSRCIWYAPVDTLRAHPYLPAH